MDDKTIRSLAGQIEHARKTHELMRPVSAQFPEATIEDAYGIQRAWVAIRLAEGPRARPQDRPHIRCLLDDTMFADGAEIPAGFFTPRGWRSSLRLF